MRILFVTPTIALPLNDGGKIRKWNVLQALRSLGQLDVVVFHDQTLPFPHKVFEGCGQVHVMDSHLLERTPSQDKLYESTVGRLGLLLGSSRPFRFLGPSNRSLSDWFATMTNEKNYDVIWISNAVTAISLKWGDTRRTIVDGDNIDFVMNLQLLRSSRWYGAKILNYVDVLKLAWWERSLHIWYARVLRCSTDDQRMLPGKNIVVIPNGTDIPEVIDRKPKNRLLFVGKLSYEPNRVGVEWFLKTVWPAIRSRVPQAELDIVGVSPGPCIQDQDGKAGVRVLGFVDDIQPYWQQAKLSLAPLLAGSGTRLKILESLAHQVPVVSTVVGAQGLNLGEQQGVFQTDSPERFANYCIDLMSDDDRNRQLGVSGYDAVATQYSWPTIHQRIRDLVQEVASESSGKEPLRYPSTTNSRVRPSHELNACSELAACSQDAVNKARSA